LLIKASPLGYEARIHLHTARKAEVHEGIIIVNGMTLIVVKLPGDDSGSVAVRTRSYLAAAPLWLTALSFGISTLLIYGHGLQAGTGVGLVLLATVLGCLVGIAIRTRVLAEARSSLRTLASSMKRDSSDSMD
jgi:hypothetical protein